MLLLDLIWGVAVGVNMAVNVPVAAENDVVVEEGKKVYAVDMHGFAPFFQETCKYNGVVIEYARDWPEEDKRTKEVKPPEPDKLAGYGLILTKEKCPGQPERRVFYTGQKPVYLLARSYVLREGSPVTTFDYKQQDEWLRPKWLPQVLKTIETEASRNSDAANFLAELKAAESAVAQQPAPQSISVPMQNTVE